MLRPSLEGEYIEETGHEVEMKEFRRNLPLLLLLTGLTFVLNCTEIFVHFWLLKCVVIIDDVGFIGCVVCWTTHHVLIFAKVTTQEYNKIRGELRSARPLSRSAQ